MNILIVGSGAREHAIAKTLYQSKHNPSLFCYGTSSNPGMSELTKDYRVGDICAVEKILHYAQLWAIQLVVIGPEAPLEQGLADALWAIGIPVIGPKKSLAQLETSKAFTRDLMQKYSIPGLPAYKVFTSLEGIAEWLQELGEINYVIKANGLMAGKGVKVAGDHLQSYDEALTYCSEVLQQNNSLVIEERLVGQEFSFMCFTDGYSLAAMPLVQDNKRAFDGDLGPNTGGMGSFSAADHSLPFLKAKDKDEALNINQKILEALTAETQERYIGVLYGGFIATARGVYVIEYNARFGDPEALNVLSILQTDFVDLCLSLIAGNLTEHTVSFAKQATVCKYAVPLGYPDNPLRFGEISIDEVIDKTHLFLASVNEESGKLYATGSRAAAFVGVADSIDKAEKLAEQGIDGIKGQLFHRKDIGTASLINQRVEAMNRLRGA